MSIVPRNVRDRDDWSAHTLVQVDVNDVGFYTAKIGLLAALITVSSVEPWLYGSRTGPSPPQLHFKDCSCRHR